MERSTPQKKAILAYLMSTRSHPTASEIYQYLSLTLPRISMATIYRNLDIFVRDGIIREIITNGDRRFDAIISDHAHFCCTMCGTVADLDMPVAHRDEIIAPMCVGSVHWCAVYAYGICALCVSRS